MNPESPHERSGLGVQDIEDLTHRVDCHGASEAGTRRAKNEDDFLIHPLGDPSTRGTRPSFLFGVADGLGGAPAGEQASAMVLEEIRRRVTAHEADPSGASGPEEVLKEAALQGQQRISRELQKHPENEGMGSTLTVAWVQWPKVHLLHVGDSRCYVVRRSSLEQVTIDHTLAQRLHEMGVGDTETAQRSPWRNTLWNVVGGRDPSLDPQVLTFDLRWGDALLLATDGLTDPLPESEILKRVHEEHRAEDVCASLIRAALEHQGTDDRTVVYAQFGRASFWKRLREILIGS